MRCCSPPVTPVPLLSLCLGCDLPRPRPSCAEGGGREIAAQANTRQPVPRRPRQDRHERHGQPPTGVGGAAATTTWRMERAQTSRAEGTNGNGRHGIRRRLLPACKAGRAGDRPRILDSRAVAGPQEARPRPPHRPGRGRPEGALLAGARNRVSNRGAGVAGARASADGPTQRQDSRQHCEGRSARPWWRPRPPRIKRAPAICAPWPPPNGPG